MTSPRRIVPLALAVVLVLALVACGGDGDGDDRSEGAPTSEASPDAGSTDGAPATDGSGSEGTPSTSDGGSSTTQPPFPGDEEPKTGEADGTGTAQLVAVRMAPQPGATRFVLEFAGDVQPGYDVRWVDGPITEDGSGNPVGIRGDAFLRVIVQPATGYDLEAGAPTYTGPPRLPGPAGGTVTQAVRTGDFESVLTWVLGATERAPFTVSALTAPSRLVIDVEALGASR